MDKLINFWKDEEGATAIEYGLLAGLIAAVIVGTVTTLGGQVNQLFTSISNALPSLPKTP
jgi:pilus assembly protein Flp/PilA